ncbi:MAG: cystathionine beta-lyase [Alphaproteobacteria bacterium]|nr:cystathionine beta-lyase [Alphaproteobacteria bacterium]
MKKDTVLIGAGRTPEENHGVVNPPVYHASTITYPSLAALEETSRKRFDTGVTYYGRYGTPTHFSLEEAVAAVEGGDRAVLCGSGKAALVAALTAFVKRHDHLLMVDTAYAPTRTFCDGFLARFGVETTYYDPLVGAGIGELIRPETKLVFVESPGSETFEVQDLPAIAKAAHTKGCIVMCDNTWASPLYCDPFALGADVSIQAATKYIAGHSDAMLGVITTRAEQHRVVRAAAYDLGASAGPDDVYLALRGMRTLRVRLERHWKTGLVLAEWLKARPEVMRVMHPALPDDPGHALWQRDFSGASGLFGLVLKPGPKEALAAMLDGMCLFAMGYSWGGYESLIVPTHPAAHRTASAWSDEGQSLRIHAGLEDVEDLIADLEASLVRYDAAR